MELIDWIEKYLGIPLSIFKGIKALIYSLFIFLEIDINVFNILFILITPLQNLMNIKILQIILKL